MSSEMAANICRESAELVQNTEGKCFRGGRAERLAGEGGQNHNLLWSCAHLKLSTGVTHVSGQSMPPYPAVDKYPLPIEYLLPNALPREGKTYLVVGFPSSQSRVNPVNRKIASRVYSFRNISHPIDKYSKIGITPESHIAIIFERKGSVGPDGKSRWFPIPQGLSGSPVCLLYDHHELDEQIPNESTPVVVVGIAIEHRKYQNTIVATDIGLPLAMINDAAQLF